MYVKKRIASEEFVSANLDVNHIYSAGILRNGYNRNCTPVA